MDDALRVRLRERFADLFQDVDRSPCFERSSLEDPVERVTRQELGDDVEPPVLRLAEVVQPQRIRVMELRDDARLVLEALDDRLVPCRLGGQHFDRDVASYVELPRAVYDTHRAAADAIEDLVPPAKKGAACEVAHRAERGARMLGGRLGKTSTQRGLRALVGRGTGPRRGRLVIVASRHGPQRLSLASAAAARSLHRARRSLEERRSSGDRERLLEGAPRGSEHDALHAALLAHT